MKNLCRPIALIILMILVCTVSCRRNSANEKRYELKGKVEAVEPDKHLITIAHDEIPNYMPSMTMPFADPDDTDFQILAVGDQIAATLVVDGPHSWLENVIITKESVDPSTSTGIVEAREGAEVPDYGLVNQDGKDIKIHHYRGKALLLTFIYTRCPLPEYCTLMSRNFAEIDQHLQQQPPLYERTHLLSISIDPEFDTPKVLRSYGAAHTERYSSETFSHWEFATGTKDQVKGIAQFFGLRYFDENGQITHGLRTVIIGPEGKVLKVYHGNDWKPDEVIKDLQKLLGK